MATTSKQPKLTFEILVDLTKEETLFDHLPDEIQLKIFKFLGIEDIINCAQVSRRTKKKSCNDESIWEKINLCNKVVPSQFIDHILQKGCKYRTRAIISRGLYTFLPHFQRPFMYCDLWPYVWLVFKSGF